MSCAKEERSKGEMLCWQEQRVNLPAENDPVLKRTGTREHHSASILTHFDFNFTLTVLRKMVKEVGL